MPPATPTITATSIGDGDEDGNLAFEVVGSGFTKNKDVIVSVLGTTSIRETADRDGAFAAPYEVNGSEGPWTFRAYQFQQHQWKKLAQITVSA